MFEISKFEALSETSGNRLVGGFSDTITGSSNSSGTLSNNCQGGNCVERCGSGQNIQCNGVRACGVVFE